MNDIQIWSKFTNSQQELLDDLLQSHDYIIDDLGDCLLQEYLTIKKKKKEKQHSRMHNPGGYYCYSVFPRQLQN